jgi:hypothetical protein
VSDGGWLEDYPEPDPDFKPAFPGSFKIAKREQGFSGIPKRAIDA